MQMLLDAVGLSPLGFAIVFGTAFLGALVQGSIGFGLNLIVVPALAAYRPESLPAASIILAIPMMLGSAVREYHHIDRSALVWVTLGRLPGIALGVWIVRSVDDAMLTRLSAGMVILAVVISIARVRLRITPVSQLSVGWVAGVMGATSSIGGPPLALLYQYESGPVMRSTLGAAFLVGSTLTLLALVAAGEVDALDWQVGAMLVPAALLGFLVSRRLHGWMDRGWLRPSVLVVCAMAGCAVLVRSVLVG
jgi:uncharacterized membrane protein YfcA